jgi:hypothetical protein
MTVRTGERLKSAAERAGSKEAEIEELEDQLADELTRIVGEADAKARKVERLPVGLEKSDISIREVALVWIPRVAE